ncbi:hypothetical protein DICSQDRAFT_174998 [Dichomitus squalens LYAD-421 SS1]|uniref:Uncharacterized protein n=2 Tax=Dichomitus squalens TaxID=114155 RepID=A0A4V2JYL4_9APHY|nr:uncharacterized protein DICSQDRAFT_174998 [Dichomitus squalens LYAD-421 SS1]EJF56316.1 hypothetical protein DICSQDRAFT_174998 [Dichomitus squalens LYAD-421 SS1]TBU21563.1 hypothetical protein BD311DRAFT_734265 [Dichomitus squalens]
MPREIRTALFTQLTELMREGPNPSLEVAQSWAERLKPRASVTHVPECCRCAIEPGRTPLPSSKPPISTAQSPSNSFATQTIPPAHQTASHLPAPSSSSEREDSNVAHESTAPARAPSASFIHFISPVDASTRAAVLDIGQVAADLRAAFARSLVEECHHCPRTFVESGALLESLQ